jgi:twitching motility two-component system response regulator PilH
MDQKVLLVEDDADVRLFVFTALERHGFTTLTAVNGEEGMQIVRDERPDLIILDILLPKQSGVKMYRELKKDAALMHIPVVVLSGISRRTFLRSQEALTESEGVSVPEPEAYLEKPVTAEELTETIRCLLPSNGP